MSTIQAIIARFWRRHWHIEDATVRNRRCQWASDQRRNSATLWNHENWGSRSIDEEEFLNRRQKHSRRPLKWMKLNLSSTQGWTAKASKLTWILKVDNLMQPSPKPHRFPKGTESLHRFPATQPNVEENVSEASLCWYRPRVQGVVEWFPEFRASRTRTTESFQGCRRHSNRGTESGRKSIRSYNF